MSHWTYLGEPISDPPENAFGFVYLITNLETGQRYLGRKYLKQTRRKPPKKGNVRKRVVRTESNWREYTSSSDKLNHDIQQLGKDRFSFEILIFGETKGAVNFAEETLQHYFKVLLDDTFYNDSIGSRKFMNVKFTDDFKQRLLSI